jgi:hypothetical protein
VPPSHVASWPGRGPSWRSRPRRHGSSPPSGPSTARSRRPRSPPHPSARTRAACRARRRPRLPLPACARSPRRRSRRGSSLRWNSRASAARSARRRVPQTPTRPATLQSACASVLSPAHVTQASRNAGQKERAARSRQRSATGKPDHVPRPLVVGRAPALRPLPLQSRPSPAAA